MATLLQLVEIYSGGPGSGCNPQVGKCGRSQKQVAYGTPRPRPHTKEETEALKKELVDVRDRLKRKKGREGYVTKPDKDRLKILREGLKRSIQYGKRKEKLAPGLRWRKKKLSLKEPIKQVTKGKTIQKFHTKEGDQITIVKPPKMYQKSGLTWMQKVSPFKGQFQKLLDNWNTMGKQERNVVFQAGKGEHGQAVVISRNYGDKRVFIREASLLSDRRSQAMDGIVRTREVAFNNFGRAMGWINKRYGITFRIVSPKGVPASMREE